MESPGLKIPRRPRIPATTEARKQRFKEITCGHLTGFRLHWATRILALQSTQAAHLRVAAALQPKQNRPLGLSLRNHFSHLRNLAPHAGRSWNFCLRVGSCQNRTRTPGTFQMSGKGGQVHLSMRGISALWIEGSAGTTAGPGASIEEDDSISPPCASGRRRSRTSPSACGSFRSRRGPSPAWRATLRSLRPAGTPPGVPSGARRSSPTRRVRAG